MAIFANTTKEEFDATIILYALFVGLTFSNQILCIAIKNVNLRWWNIDLNNNAGMSRCKNISGNKRGTLREELSEHEGVIRFRMIPREPDIFIHIECNDVLEPVCTRSWHNKQNLLSLTITCLL
jgi:hypothetical protein